ncbi:MAG: hypothetical protein Q8K34_12810 [Hydrogenophaga sp.]|nr:hypothetical protein [Hydrogenophaga sp.]
MKAAALSLVELPEERLHPLWPIHASLSTHEISAEEARYGDDFYLQIGIKND